MRWKEGRNNENEEEEQKGAKATFIFLFVAHAGASSQRRRSGFMVDEGGQKGSSEILSPGEQILTRHPGGKTAERKQQFQTPGFKQVFENDGRPCFLFVSRSFPMAFL